MIGINEKNDDVNKTLFFCGNGFARMTMRLSIGGWLKRPDPVADTSNGSTPNVMARCC